MAFAIIGIVAIETGLLTPPLGLCVYTVKGLNPDTTLGKIFFGINTILDNINNIGFLIAFFPCTWLPSKM